MPILSQNINLRQSQSLVMTPQLQQSLKLLELSTQDLLEYIEQELEKNPLLEKVEGNSEQRSDNKDEIVDDNSLSDKDVFEVSSDNDSPDMKSELDTEYENVWQDAEENKSTKKDEVYEPYSSSQRGGGDFDKTSYFEQTIAGDISLEEHLFEQIVLEFSDPREQFIASNLLDYIDEKGYLICDIVNLSAIWSCNMDLLEKIIAKCQQFSPSGIFARSLEECISIQLKDKNRFDPTIEKLLQNINLIADCEFKKLAKICGVNEQEIHEMCAEIRMLNPKPAGDFITEITHGVVADIFLCKNDDGNWKLELNTETLPRLLVNNNYYSEVKKHANDESEIKYVSEQLNTANWLVKTLHQRADTILKVSTELVVQQEDFLEKGIMYLKPMILSDIANSVGVHESTVGRVTSNKYISTPRGLFELKYFFSSSIHSSKGEDDFSSKSVKYVIKNLIDAEPHDLILSDDKISEILKTRGMDVARRTVSKYRESLKIPSSVQRRKQKKIA